MRIAVAGATGFVGRSFIQSAKGYGIRALGRSSSPPAWLPAKAQWRSTDLYSLLEAEQALKGCDVALYLVHSMLPSARLTQGSFADTDLILADNFARAARKARIKKIVYLGGILPDLPEEELSPHLHSRLEVERVLGSTGIPVISLRAALVLGAGGSSFEMMRKLVDRLPVMICPSWTSSLSNPVYIDDLLSVLSRVIEEKRSRGAVVNLPGPDRLNYIQLMQKTARALKRRRLFLPVSLYSPRLSLLWIRLITGSSRELVEPLVESLKHDMVASPPARFRKLLNTGLDTALQKIVETTADQSSLESSAAPAISGGRAGNGQTDHRMSAENHGVASPEDRSARGRSGSRSGSSRASLVRSIQRLPLPRGRDAVFLAELYPIWLQGTLKPFLRIERDPQSGKVSFYGLGLRLLELTLSEERSDPSRQLYYVTGGMLVARGSRGRLEFRILPSVDCALAA
ncbi:MAG: NAD(P)H-binding protein, partial [Leptospiraceae bacterium]|nr:NAD(P)H-binding protein [Leptospiraceae bacterium]